MSNSRDSVWLKLARHYAAGSTDPSTKVGCLIVTPSRVVIATAVNGIPAGVNGKPPERHARPDKYHWYEHAERAAIFRAVAKNEGPRLRGATLYVTSYPDRFPPCADCARAIIQVGIARVVQEPPMGDYARWADSCAAALRMFAEAGVAYDLVELPAPSLQPGDLGGEEVGGGPLVGGPPEQQGGDATD